MTSRDPAEEGEGVLATEVASTPSPFSSVAPSGVLDQLEFATALDAVARHAVSSLGADSVRGRRPGTSLDTVRHELSTVAEFQRLLDAGDPFRPENVPDVTAAAQHLRVAGSVLEPEQLNAVRIAVEGMHRVKRGLARIANEAPLVACLAEEVPPMDVAGRIAKALDPDGSVKDDASPELARARRRVRDTRAKLVALLEKQLRAYGQDAGGEVTMKGGRYVIPVRRDDRGRVQGIVHGESSSGATLFVEPPEAVQLGNELSAWESEEARAVLAVLRDLTDAVRSHREALESGLRMCARADDAYARAHYAVETDGHAPTVVAAPANLAITRGLHPLLLIETEQPVPFDLELSGTEHTLLVSGPNAGGKTVMLKAVGLLSAMAQSGIVPPVGPGTTLPVFERLFVDIGDHQSIAASLSTFSAHMAALKHILLHADAASLVLLDEIGGGTDPMEGAALAGATLLSLNARGSTTVATTHLGELKDLASDTDGIVNGSLQFNVETLTPTYRFIKNQPGRSYGIAIARRLGLPAEVLERAEQLQPEQARSLDAVLADVERKEEELARRAEDVSFEAARLSRLRGESETLKQQLDERQRSVTERERELEREGRKQAREFMLKARRRVEEALDIAKRAADDAAVKEARRMVEQGVSEQGEALARLEEIGWRVSGNREPGTGNGGSSAPSFRRSAEPTALPSTELDLRGLTGDEAEDALVLAIDEAVADALPWLRIIHGKGTGALRKRVSQVLKRDGRVATFRLAPPHQGGSGVTIVDFKK